MEGYTEGQKPGRAVASPVSPTARRPSCKTLQPLLRTRAARRRALRLLLLLVREGRLPHRLEHLCRLDAVGLRGAFRHRRQVGREVRHHHRGGPVQRLHRVHQPVHGRGLRRLHHDQHGRPDDPGRRGRRLDGAHRGRLLERQRRHRAEGRRQVRRGPAGAGREPRGTLRVALPARPRALERRHDRARPDGGEHLRRGHRRRVRDGRRHLGGDLEPAAGRSAGHAGYQPRF